MSEVSKTHYRRVYKSNHLGSADLEDFIEEKRRLVFTISHVNQEYNVSVAGKKGNFNIAYFKEDIKPLVLGAKTAKMVRKFCKNSAFVEDWNNVLVELYIDPNVKFAGEIVGGIRIKPNQPIKTKPVLTPGCAKWDKAKKSGLSFEELNKHYEITKENYDKLCG